MPYKREYHKLICPRCNKEYQVLTQSYKRKMQDEKYGLFCNSCRSKIQWEEMSDEQKAYMRYKSIQGTKIKYESLTDEEKEINKNKRIEGIKKYWGNLSDKDKKDISIKRSEQQKELIKNRKNNMINKIYEKRIQNNSIKYTPNTINKTSLTEEEKKWNNLSDTEKIKFINQLNIEKYESSEKKKKPIRNLRFENAFRESHLVNTHYFILGEKTNNDGFEYIWDYGIYDKSNNILDMVIDVDTDEDSNIYEYRNLSIPIGTKHCILYNNKLFKSFALMIRLVMKNYIEYIQYMFDLCRKIPFPYPKYQDQELINSFKLLQKLNPANANLNTRTGDKLINQFHESIYRAKRNDSLSPYEAWYDDELLLKVIQNRIIYQTYLNPNKILQGFNIAKVAQKVSVFSAGRAKVLINKYLNDYDTIFDPFSGFSGRMLGTISLGKRYIGQDISEIHVEESNRMIQFLKDKKFNIRAEIINKDILQSEGEYPCLFTCSPYSDKEQWENVDIDRRNCDDWIDECLKRFKCNKYLFVVDETNRYKEYIVDDIDNRSHLTKNNELVILIDRSK